TALGDELLANGVPMKIAAFETRAKPPEILEYYAGFFSRMGWWWTGLKFNLQAVPYPAISATEPDTMFQYSVVAIEHEEGDGTTVLIGLADMNEAQDPGKVVAEGDLPPYPGTRPLKVSASDREVTTTTVSFATKDDEKSVASFYRSALAEQGF